MPQSREVSKHYKSQQLCSKYEALQENTEHGKGKGGPGGGTRCAFSQVFMSDLYISSLIAAL